MSVSMRFAAAVLLLTLAGCASLSRSPRPAQSSYGCMQAVVAEKLPPHVTEKLQDKRNHCLAAGLIARYCSVSEAYFAGLGKELRDLFGAGDAEWADWRADRAGVGCAKVASEDAELATCCSERGY